MLGSRVNAVGATDAPEVLERFHAELSLVEIVAGQIARSVGRAIEFDDLVGAGREGLLNAARRFEPDRGVPFRAYANFRVRGAILDAVRQLSVLPRRAHERIAALEAAMLTSEGAAERAFSDQTPDADAADRALEKHVASLAMAAVVGMATETHDEASEEDSPEEALARAELVHIVRGAIGQLSKDEGTVVRRHYLEGDRLEDIARDLEMSESWASRIHTRAIARLAKRLHNVA